MKKIFIYGILYILLASCLTTLVLFGIDIETTRQDYQKAKENGNYEQKIDGCIFNYVCEKYTKELMK